MKRLLLILIMLCSIIPLQSVVLYEEEIPKENVVQVLRDVEGKFHMTYYKGRELKIAFISKKDVEKYFLYKQAGVDYHVILQHLKTKDKIVIKC